MSRIGRKPVAIPSGVKVTLASGSIAVKGPKGELSFSIPRGITVQQGDAGAVMVSRASDERAQRALHGLVRSLIANMVKGVTDGFTKTLEVIGVGYGAKIQGKQLMLSVGYSEPVSVPIPDDIKIAEPKTANIAMTGIGSVPVTTLVITGIDKQHVGQFAATVRAVKPPEPYKGKGIKYIDEVVRRKAGKAMAGAE